MGIRKWARDLLEGLFDLKRFSGIVIETPVIDDLLSFAKAAHPKEFMALLQGDVKDSTLAISSVIYQPFVSSRASSSMRMDLPPLSKASGTAHSHPSGSAYPSSTDLRFFSKSGAVHLIIAFPYTYDSVSCFDSSGRRMGIYREEKAWRVKGGY